MTQQQLGNPEVLAQISHVGHKIKYAADITELHFIACNSIKAVVNFHQAFFWQYTYYNKPKLQASAGTSALDQNAPMVVFLHRMIEAQIKMQEKPELVLLDKNYFDSKIVEEWGEWLPEHVLWCPLVSSSKAKVLIGGLIFTREYPWTNTDVQIIELLCSFISLSLSMFMKKTGNKKPLLTRVFRKTSYSAIFACAVVALLLPIYQTVLAPAEIVAEHPTIITSPINEVVDQFYVTPNQHVNKGDRLFSLNQTELKSNVLISMRDYQEALEKLRGANQFSFENAESSAKLSILKLEAEKLRLKLEYHTEILNNSIITAPVSGVAIFADENDWIGKPVKIGEKVLEIADPDAKRLKMLLPVADAITLKPGGEIKFYLNTSPLDVIDSKLSYASYSAHAQPDGIYAYTLKSDFVNMSKVPRIGLRGTAKIYGERVTLFYYVMRKPFAALRQKLGI